MKNRLVFPLVIPEHDHDFYAECDEDTGLPYYPGNILPGRYSRDEFVKLMRQHCGNSEAIEFLADMLEE
jgi:hypothetical protein